VQAIEQALRQLGPDGVVAAERPIVDRRRLPDVVQERRQADDRTIRRRSVHRPQRVVEQVLVGDLVLLDAALGRQLGKHHLEEARLGHQPQADRWRRGQEQLLELGRDALA